jgi:toxin ParE1/3/4
MRVLYSKRGMGELHSAYDWYEERRIGLGRHFLILFRSIINNISRYPEMYPRYRDNIRHASMKKFPYAIFYSIEDNNVILVRAVFQVKQNPNLKP